MPLHKVTKTRIVIGGETFDEVSHRGVVANVLDCGFEVSEFGPLGKLWPTLFTLIYALNALTTMMGLALNNQSKVKSKVGDRSPVRPESSLFNSYFTEV